MNQQQRENTSTVGRDGQGVSVGTLEGMAERVAGGFADDVANRLPANLWSDERDVQELRSMVAGGPGGSVRKEWMSEEDKKQAAMKTIAHLQEWATKQRAGSAEPLGGSRIGGGNGNVSEASGGSGGMGGVNGMGQGYGMGRSVPQRGTMEQGVSQPMPTRHYTGQQQYQQPNHQQQQYQQPNHQQQQYQQPNHQQQQYQRQNHPQQQSQYEYEYAAVLQRIIQDYLSGKLLTVVERQLLQQYIQMEQQKRVAQQQAQQQAHLRDQEMAQRLYQDHMERLQMGQRHMGNGFRDSGMGPSLGGLGGGMGEMDGMMNAAGISVAGLPGGMTSGVGVHVGGARVGGHVGDAGVIGGGIHPQSHGFNRHSGNHSQNYNGMYNAQRRQAGPPLASGNANPRTKHGSHGGVNSEAGRPPAANPVQTLQEIGRTLSMLGITVEVAVNAGLLGGLSATDVRIVAEAHRLENELKGINGSAGNTQRSNSLPVGSLSGYATSGDSSPPKSPRLDSSFGNLSVPTPSSPAWSTGSLSNQLSTESLPTGLMHGGNGISGLDGLKGEADDADPYFGTEEPQRVPSGGNGRCRIGSSRSSAANDKSVSGGSIYASTGDDQSNSATASGSASIVGDQQKDDDGGEGDLKGFSEGIVGEDAEAPDTKIASYLDSLSLGTGW